MQTRLLHANDPVHMLEAGATLRQGGLVAMPTETVYGLAANAKDEQAVAKIFAAKERPSFDPLIVHVPSFDQAEAYATFDPVSAQLGHTFWPGPLTLVLERKPEGGIGDLVTSGLSSVAIRVPSKPAARALLREAGVPLAAPSANRFGSVSPTTAAHVQAELGGRIDAILDAGPCERGIESTVVKVKNGKPVILRLGALSVADIAQELNLKEAQVEVRQGSSRPGEAMPSPGMTDRHYAPNTKMRLVGAADLKQRPHLLVGLLAFCEPRPGFHAMEVLSERGDSVEAAARLFAALRHLDEAGCMEIWAELAPVGAAGGLGAAINDRLKRAAG